MAKSSVWETLENCNFVEISLFEDCDRSRYLKNFEMCFTFSTLLGHFVKGFGIFEVSNHLEMAQYCVVWKILKNRNFENISVFEVCSDSRMHKMNSWEV